MSDCECDHEGTLIGTTWQRSRRLRWCAHCATRIEAGELHEVQGIAHDGTFSSVRVHLDCALMGCCDEGRRPPPMPFARYVRRVSHYRDGTVCGEWFQLNLRWVTT